MRPDPSILNWRHRESLRLAEIEYIEQYGTNIGTTYNDDYNDAEEEYNDEDDDHMEVEEPMADMLDAFDPIFDNDLDDEENTPNDGHEDLLEEALRVLYPGASISKLAASLLILNLQAKFKWSNASVTALLE